MTRYSYLKLERQYPRQSFTGTQPRAHVHASSVATSCRDGYRDSTATGARKSHWVSTFTESVRQPLAQNMEASISIC